MSAKAWGQKRICSCGKIRFYDLNKTKIECPECAEIIDIDFLSNNKMFDFVFYLAINKLFATPKNIFS